MKTDDAAYDTAGYPRRGRAYRGASTGMSTLGTAEPVLQKFADAIRAATAAADAGMPAACKVVGAANGALTADQRDTMQYNPEIVDLIDRFDKRLTAFTQQGTVPPGSDADIALGRQAINDLRVSAGGRVHGLGLTPTA